MGHSGSPMSPALTVGLVFLFAACSGGGAGERTATTPDTPLAWRGAIIQGERP